MKKIITLILPVILLVLSACDDDWKNEDAPMNNLAHYDNIRFTDYSSLPAGTFPAMNGYFTPNNPATGYLETWLINNYFTVDIGSTANVTYDFMDYDRADSLNYLSQLYYTLESTDYRLVWGTPFVEAFTPDMPATISIPEILQAKEPNATESSYKVIQYNYSAVEPTIEPNQEVIYFSEDFESFSAYDTWSNFEIPGVFRKDIWGVGRNWQIYNRGGILGMLGYIRNGVGGNVWFITYELDLSAAINPVYEFDLGIGYYEGVDCLNILVSEEFDGENPLDSSWENLNDELGIESLNRVTGYPSSLTTLRINLGKYAGKKIYLAYQNTLPIIDVNYTNAPLYVIDNIKLSEIRDVASIPEPEVKYAAYKYTNNTWKELNSVYVLQDEDYQLIGLEYLTAEEAHELIPGILAQRITTPSAGKELVVVYKQTTSLCYAENYIYNTNKWEYEKLPDTQLKSESFLYKNLEEKWKYNQD